MCEQTWTSIDACIPVGRYICIAYKMCGFQLMHLWVVDKDNSIFDRINA